MIVNLINEKTNKISVVVMLHKTYVFRKAIGGSEKNRANNIC